MILKATSSSGLNALNQISSKSNVESFAYQQRKTYATSQLALSPTTKLQIEKLLEIIFKSKLPNKETT